MARNHQVAARFFFCIALLLFVMLAACSEDPAEPVNNPPHSPRNPLPADSTTADVDTVLHWEASDPEGDPLTFDVHFGTTDPPPAVSNNQSEKMYDPGTLEYGEKYLWKIVSKDDHGHETAGPLWMFTTGANQAPSEPINPDPANDAVDQPISPQLGWDDCTDPEGDPIQYDIYLDVVSPVTTKVDSNLSASTWNVGPLDYGTKYYWRVVAMDFGIKYNILRSLEKKGCNILVLPAGTDSETINKLEPQGLFLSNGPGDPEAVTYAVDTIRQQIDKRPIFGICLGLRNSHQFRGRQRWTGNILCGQRL